MATIRPGQQPPGYPDHIFEKSIIDLYDNRPLPTNCEELYNAVGDLVSSQHVRIFCEKLRCLIDSRSKLVLEQFKDANFETMDFLRTLNHCWKQNCDHLTKIKALSLVLDRKFDPFDRAMGSVWDHGIERFRHYFASNNSVLIRTTEDIILLIKSERQEGVIDRSLVKDLLCMLSTLSLYETHFEPRFFEETQIHYKLKSKEEIDKHDVPQYLHYVNRMIQEETERSTQYLASLTQKHLIETVEKELIEVHLSYVLNNGLSQLIDQLRMDDLALLHSLVGRVPNGLNELCNQFKEYIKAKGDKIVCDPEADRTMVQDLLNFKHKIDRVVTECFQDQERFVYCVKEAFETFINLRPNKPAELIAKYIDSKLRSGNKESTDDELEKTLDEILVLFRFVHGKDVFEAFYKKDLAKRLLVNKSASVDAEKSMLSKLRQECGSAFTSKLEGMFKDIDLTKDLMIQFKNHLNSQRNLDKIDLTVHVLTMGYWPTYVPMQVKLPPFMNKYLTAFKKFYTTRKHGRKLQWQPNLGHCTLIARFEANKNELIVSLFQALVLLLFNETDELDYKEIEANTKIEELELKRTLQSLACGKKRVLIKKPPGRDVAEDDKFLFNKKFTDPLYKIKINQVQLKETQEEQTMTEERVFQDRQYLIDAAIVRIMKTRKKLPHPILVAEVISHMKFPIQAQDIKTRIDSLIDRDFIQRDAEHKETYNYVA